MYIVYTLSVKKHVVLVIRA